jgi:hypothetical protein
LTIFEFHFLVGGFFHTLTQRCLPVAGASLLQETEAPRCRRPRH